MTMTMIQESLWVEHSVACDFVVGIPAVVVPIPKMTLRPLHKLLLPLGCTRHPLPLPLAVYYSVAKLPSNEVGISSFLFSYLHLPPPIGRATWESWPIIHPHLETQRQITLLCDLRHRLHRHGRLCHCWGWIERVDEATMASYATGRENRVACQWRVSWRTLHLRQLSSVHSLYYYLCRCNYFHCNYCLIGNSMQQ